MFKMLLSLLTPGKSVAKSPLQNPNKNLEDPNTPKPYTPNPKPYVNR